MGAKTGLIGVVFVFCIVLMATHQVMFARLLGDTDDAQLKDAKARIARAIGKSQTPDGFDAGGLSYQTKIPGSPKKWDVCMVGAGISGSVMAERYANVLGKTSLVMDSRQHIGGNVYDFREKVTGLLMNLYGAHLFHTNSERVWRYISLFKKSAGWKRWDHTVIGKIDGRLLPIPVNIDTVNGLFDESIQGEKEMDAWLKKVRYRLQAEQLARGHRPTLCTTYTDLRILSLSTRGSPPQGAGAVSESRLQERGRDGKVAGRNQSVREDLQDVYGEWSPSTQTDSDLYKC
jgi:hypothetical protein